MYHTQFSSLKMNPNKSLFLLACLLLVLVFVVETARAPGGKGPSKTTKTNNNKNRTRPTKPKSYPESQVLHHKKNILELLNRHRNNTKALKFSLTNVEIERNRSVKQFDLYNESHLLLNDGSEVLFAPKHINHLYRGISEYRFEWNATNESKVKPEVCFHYAFNDASW